MILSPKSYSNWWQCWCFFCDYLGDDCDCDTGRLATLQADATAPSLVQPSPWLRFLQCLLCLAQSSRWSINLLKSSNPITLTLTNIPHSTFSSTIAKKDASSLDCQVVLGGEERPALVLEGPPALTQPARFFIFLLFSACFLIFYCFWFFGYFVCFLLLLCLFQGARREEGGGKKGGCSVKNSFFWSGLFF